MLAFANLRGGLGATISAGRRAAVGDEKLYIFFRVMEGDVARSFDRLDASGTEAEMDVGGAVRISEMGDGEDDSITRFLFFGVVFFVSRVDEVGRLWRGIELRLRQEWVKPGLRGGDYQLTTIEDRRVSGAQRQ
jgi:hypothetical protein